MPLLTGQNAHQNLTGSRKGLTLQIQLFLRNFLENENNLDMTNTSKIKIMILKSQKIQFHKGLDPNCSRQ